MVSGAWQSRAASDQNLKSFPGGEALAAELGELLSQGQPGLPEHGRCLLGAPCEAAGIGTACWGGVRETAG